MAKDTEKLIRQLSLIAFLMAERRPVIAAEIRRDVEGYSDMTEDAFARRFYADRAELESLGIQLTIDRPADGLSSDQENYSLASEAFHLPAIAFTDEELAALRTSLFLLDGEFAYAEPLRLALQQITWGRPNPLDQPTQRTIGLGITASAGGQEVGARLAKIDTAIYRRKRIEFEYFTMTSGETHARKVDPYGLIFQGGQFYLVGHSHERDAVRVFRLSRIKGKVAYSTKAEHDFQRPDDFDPRAYGNRIPWQLGEQRGTAEVWVSERIAWQVRRHFGAYGELVHAPGPQGSGQIFRTGYAIGRLLISWTFGFGEHARVLGPPELAAEAAERLARVVEQHRGEPTHADPVPPPAPVAPTGERRASRARASADTIRPERFARLVALASILIAAGRAGERLQLHEVLDGLQISEQELREDINVLNVVNFGGGAYVLYAEVHPDGTIEVDPEPYADTFDRPARLLPIEAKALIAAIDLLGDHIPAGSLASAREKIVAALGEDPVREGLQITTAVADDPDLTRVIGEAVSEHRLLELEYYAANEDAFTIRRIEPYGLLNSKDGWYVAGWDPAKSGTRHFRLDRIKRATLQAESFTPRPELSVEADIEGWPRTGEVPASRTARVRVSPDQARWASEERSVLAELQDGSVIVQWPFKGTDFLVKEVLREAGDAVVLEPADAREAVLRAAEGMQVAAGAGAGAAA